MFGNADEIDKGLFDRVLCPSPNSLATWACEGSSGSSMSIFFICSKNRKLPRCDIHRAARSAAQSPCGLRIVNAMAR